MYLTDRTITAGVVFRVSGWDNRLRGAVRVIGSGKPPGYYDEATLLALEKAFTDSWAILSVHAPSRGSEGEAKLRTRLADKLLALVAEGVTHPDELRRLSLESFPRMSSSAAKNQDPGSSA
jgi:hypothetical protein